MSIGDYPESSASKALKAMDRRFIDIAKGFCTSPLNDAMQRLHANHLRIDQQWQDIARPLQLSISNHTRAFEEMSRVWMPFVEQMERIQAPFQEMNNRLAAISQPFQDMNNRLAAISQPFQKINDQFQVWRNQFTIPDISSSFRGISEAIRSIPPDVLMKIRLNSNYWIIVDDTLLLSLVRLDSDDDKDVVEFIINYYKEDNWSQLEQLKIKWSEEISSERTKIFGAALSVVRESYNEDVHLCTVPTLIAQIDGLVRELYSLLPKTERKRVEQKIRENLPEETKGKRLDLRQDVAVQTVAEVVDYWSAEMLQEMIFGGLFRDSNKIDSDESYALFRHKIMHGDAEYLNYGNEENFIRLMLYADFVISLISQIRRGSLPIESPAAA